VRVLQTSGHTHIITRTHAELDLIDQRAVKTFYDEERPEYVVLALSRPPEEPALECLNRGDPISAPTTNPPIPSRQISHQYAK